MPRSKPVSRPSPSVLASTRDNDASSLLPPLLQPGAGASAIASPSLVRSASPSAARDATHLDVASVSATQASYRPRSRNRQSGRTHQQQHQHSRLGTEDRTDALWAEMQNTLMEVELNARNISGGGIHVFGPEHAKALEELRSTQIALAQAWARSEADDVASEADDGVAKTSLLGVDDTSSNSEKNDAQTGTRGSKLEEETEKDIRLARKRREANDWYFSKVNGGVLDVVARLDGVAGALRRVERESKEIWDEDV